MKYRMLPSFALLVLVASTSLGSATIARLGPPTICFPFHVADETKCLAEKRDAVVLADAPVERLVCASLDASDDALTRMESLRRAFFWTGNEAERDAITAALEHRVVLAELREDPASKRARALAWFTLGYWRQVVAEGSRERFGSERAYLDKALRIDDSDPAMHFGAAIASFLDKPAFYSFIARAHAANERAGGESSLVAENMRTVLDDLAPELTKDGFAAIGTNAAKRAETSKPR